MAKRAARDIRTIFTPGHSMLGVLLYDSILGALCMYAIMRVRYFYEGKFAPNDIDIKAAIIFGLSCLAVWPVLRVHKAIWRFISFDDVRNILQAVILASLITPVILFLFFNRADDFPRSAPFAAGLLFFGLLIGSRALVLFYRNGDIRNLFRAAGKHLPPAIVVGRSETLHDFLRRSKNKNGSGAYNIRGLIDTAGSHKGRSIAGLPIFGNLSDVPTAIGNLERLHGVKPTLILADPKTDAAKAGALVKIAAAQRTPLVRLRPDGSAGLSPLEVSDLIGRRAKALDMAPVHRFIADKRVMITGAGGTIGAELTRQVAQMEPAELILLDASEMNLFFIEHEMARAHTKNMSAVLADVRNLDHLDEVFAAKQPQIILHAAALKHVPLMEANPIEALLTNIGGTSAIIDMAIKHKAESFTLISTDKAVNPSNIMGASKRIAEMLTVVANQAAGNEDGHELAAAAVRFGNVLASNGSVVQLFEKQIAQGGPVTVTDKDAERFFMTTHEAASLVLQAAALNAGQRKDYSEIYVLDMGEPVNIHHLARQLIRLRGLVPERDIEIEFTGLRPGEKLTEVLTGIEENLESTYVKGVSRFTRQVKEPQSVARHVNALLTAARARDRKAVRAALSKLIPDFKPNGGLS